MKRILEEMNSDLLGVSFIVLMVCIGCISFLSFGVWTTYNDRLKYEACLSKAVDVKDCAKEKR